MSEQVAVELQPTEPACPKCGGYWLPAVGSQLTCHARCFHTPEEQEALLCEYEADAALTLNMLAERHGIPRSVLYSSISYAKKRRRHEEWQREEAYGITEKGFAFLKRVERRRRG